MFGKENNAPRMTFQERVQDFIDSGLLDYLPSIKKDQSYNSLYLKYSLYSIHLEPDRVLFYPLNVIKQDKSFVDAMILTLFPKFSSTKPTSTNILNDLYTFMTGRKQNKGNVVKMKLFQSGSSDRPTPRIFYPKESFIIEVDILISYAVTTFVYIVTNDAQGREKFVRL